MLWNSLSVYLCLLLQKSIPRGLEQHAFVMGHFLSVTEYLYFSNLSFSIHVSLYLLILYFYYFFFFIFITLHWAQMADVSNGRRPFQTGLRWPILKFEFDDHLIFYNLMFDSQFLFNFKGKDQTSNVFEYVVPNTY